MKVALSWINEYVPIDDIAPKEFANALTMSGSMVEGVEVQGENIDHVVTGRILEIKGHPDADKLVVCQVDAGGETVQIVTGATNMKEGDCVAVAKDGATLPGGRIKKGKLRGVESCGMMCSEDELGLAQERAGGIMILPPDTSLGVDIREYLGINEKIAEFEITSNRPDCLSVIGLARETAATFRRPLTVKEPVVPDGGGDISAYLKVRVEDAVLCPRYCARVVKNVKIGPSPQWLRARLESSGIRSINNIVDITNYVMLEYGQPMHAFDLRTISGGEIVVRRASAGEALTTLDGAEHILTPSALVIADGERAVALAGVMGGENSEVRPDTRTIIFESANFEGGSVRQSAKAVSLRTESSSRFEKGLDPQNALLGVQRACELVHALGAGDVVSGLIDVCAPLPAPRVLPLEAEKINRLLGTQIDTEFMKSALASVGFGVDGDNLTVPTYRADVEVWADVAEEVARLYGYDNLPMTLHGGSAGIGGKSDKQKAEDLAKEALVSLGLNEIVTYSFVSPRDYEKLGAVPDDYIKIANPQGEEQSIMRTTAIPSALEVLSVNEKKRNPRAWMFELATTYHKRDDSPLAHERQDLVIALSGGGADYFRLKGIVEQLFDVFGITYYDIEAEEKNPVFHPGQTGRLLLGRKEAALLGRVHPAVEKRFDISAPAFVAVVNFELLLQYKRMERKYKPLPKYPAVTRDIAVVVKREVPARSIEDIFRKTKGGLIEAYSLFDVYTGAQVEEGYKSMAYALTFRAPDRTLTDEEVGQVTDSILSQLEGKLGAQLRG